MTTPDSRPIHDVIADVIHEAEGRDWPDVSTDPDGGCLGGDRCRFVAAAVVAACQQATVEQQRELTKAEVESRTEAIYEGIYLADERVESRLVGPWREDPS